MVQQFFFSGDDTVTPPANPKLTIQVVTANPVLRRFIYTLTRPVDAVLTINQASADNYLACGGPAQGSMVQNGAIVIPIGSTTNADLSPTIYGTVNGNHNMVYNVKVNGTTVTNGGTIVIGSFTVDIDLQQCS